MTMSIPWPQAPCPLQALLDCAAHNFDAAGLYYGHGTDNAWDEALTLALHGLGYSWDVPEEVLQLVLGAGELGILVELFERRIRERQPAAYMTGTAWFAGLPFRVSKDVLIPRSPFAELIEQGYQPWLAAEPARILDLCTGSGCIGIATALSFPRAEVDLSDISEPALAIAGENIAAHSLENRVRLRQGDLFSGVSDSRYDLIVCNPPYVDAEDFASMPEEYRAEPTLALASGPDGLDFTRRLLREARQHLSDEGCLFVEVGNSWEALERAYPRVPFMWLEFAHGGHGVFLLTARELERFAVELG